MSSDGYVHGYSSQENSRLVGQATTLTELLHGDTAYEPESLVLEAGCGVGAQTAILASTSSATRFVSMDLSPASAREACVRTCGAGHRNVAFVAGDIMRAPYPPETFDHLFVCFVLEHLPDPVGALRSLRGLLKGGGTITVIEGDHGSAYFHPDSPDARRAIQCLVDIQAELGGDSLIGRRLYPLLLEAGFQEVGVSPRMVYADGSRPGLVEGFTKKTFTAMVEGVGELAVERGLVDPAAWARGIAGLYRTAEKDGTFCYTFFKGTARK